MENFAIIGKPFSLLRFLAFNQPSEELREHRSFAAPPTGQPLISNLSFSCRFPHFV
jgi:hypothetical protein